MDGLRTSRTILLSVALLLFLLGIFLPVAHSIVVHNNGEPQMTTVEERYSLFGFETIVDGPKDVGHSDGETRWSDSSLDGSGGISYLRVTPFTYIIGILFVVAALVTTVLRNVGETRTGGVLSALGFLTLLVTVVSYGAGLTLRNDDVFVDAWVPEAILMGYLVTFALLLLLIASLLGMISTRVTERVIERGVTVEHATPAETDAFGGPRYFRCNTCGTVETVVGHQHPVCSSCGNSTPAPL